MSAVEEEGSNAAADGTAAESSPRARAQRPAAVKEKIEASPCSSEEVKLILPGTYTYWDMHHGRPVYRRIAPAMFPVVLIYFWDERDGEELCGWWFGPKVGGDQVWGYHPSRSMLAPPHRGWQIPHDGLVDRTFRLGDPAPVDKDDDEDAGYKPRKTGDNAAKQTQSTPTQPSKKKKVRKSVMQKKVENLEKEKEIFQRQLQEMQRKMEEQQQQREEEMTRRMAEGGEPDEKAASVRSRSQASMATKAVPQPRDPPEDSIEPASVAPAAATSTLGDRLREAAARAAMKGRAAAKREELEGRATAAKQEELEGRGAAKREELEGRETSAKREEADEPRERKREDPGADDVEAPIEAASRLPQQPPVRESEDCDSVDDDREPIARRRRPYAYPPTLAPAPRAARASDGPSNERRPYAEAFRESRSRPPLRRRREAGVPMPAAAGARRVRSPSCGLPPLKRPRDRIRGPEEDRGSPRKVQEQPQQQPMELEKLQQQEEEDKELKNEEKEEEKPELGIDGGAPQPEDKEDTQDKTASQGARSGRDSEAAGGDELVPDLARGMRRVAEVEAKRRQEEDVAGEPDGCKIGAWALEAAAAVTAEEDKERRRREEQREKLQGGSVKTEEDKERRRREEEREKLRRDEEEEREFRRKRAEEKRAAEEHRMQAAGGARTQQPPSQEDEKEKRRREEREQLRRDEEAEREFRRRQAEEKRLKAEEASPAHRPQDEAKRRKVQANDKDKARAEKDRKRKEKEEEEQRRRKKETAEKEEKRRREEEHRRREEQVEAFKREEERRLQEEVRKRAEIETRKEQKAVLTFLAVLRMFTEAVPEDYEKLRARFDWALRTQLPHSGGRREALQAEADRVLRHTASYVERLREQRRLGDEWQVSQRRKRAEEEAAALQEAPGLIKELEQLVLQAEHHAKTTCNATAPLAGGGGGGDLLPPEIMRIVAAAEAAGDTAVTACTACSEFLISRQTTLGKAEGLPEELRMRVEVLRKRIQEATNQTVEALKLAEARREQLTMPTVPPPFEP